MLCFMDQNIKPLAETKFLRKNKGLQVFEVMVKVNKVAVIMITVIMKVMEVIVLITKIIPITSTINDIVISVIHASLV